MEVFYPSCNFARISPQAAKRVRQQMKGVMDVFGCCLREKRELGEGDVGIYLCQSCRAHVKGGSTESLWEWALRQDDFEWPSYEGLKVIIQDCWRDVDHPEVHAAVREALERMDVAWAEPEDARERSTFCGTRHVEPRTPRQRELMADHPDPYVRKMPEGVQRELMAERVRELEAAAREAFGEAGTDAASASTVASAPSVSAGTDAASAADAGTDATRDRPLILTSCNTCTQGLRLGGGNVVHLGELVMGTY